MAKNQPPLSTNLRIKHKKFGLGVVLDTNSRYTLVEFDEHGQKKFMTELLQKLFVTSDEPAPEKPKRRTKKKTTKKKATKKKATKKKATKKKKKASDSDGEEEEE